MLRGGSLSVGGGSRKPDARRLSRVGGGSVAGTVSRSMVTACYARLMRVVKRGAHPHG